MNHILPFLSLCYLLYISTLVALLSMRDDHNLTLKQIRKFSLFLSLFTTTIASLIYFFIK